MGTDDGDERKTFGTAAPSAPIRRADFERAVRYLHLSDADARELMLRLAAQVVALTEVLDEETRARVEQSIGPTLERIRTADVRTPPRARLDTSLENKYEISSSSPPCDELLHLCSARCCQMQFPLSTADLDEGVIRWDYGQPYLIRQRASDGFCVHNDPSTHACTVHAQRPATCRRYDCRNDSRVWIDYAKRIPAPLDTPSDDRHSLEPLDLVERLKLRTAAEAIETNAITHVYADDEPEQGPPPAPRRSK